MKKAKQELTGKLGLHESLTKKQILSLLLAIAVVLTLPMSVTTADDYGDNPYTDAPVPTTESTTTAPPPPKVTATESTTTAPTPPPPKVTAYEINKLWYYSDKAPNLNFGRTTYINFPTAGVDYTGDEADAEFNVIGYEVKVPDSGTLTFNIETRSGTTTVSLSDSKVAINTIKKSETKCGIIITIKQSI
ncbi:MAG: hypothetical protein FWF94_02310 [Oscillospiraceae bacterium]|nr:hypothetical protein [Oscillospiraceae bacterium]